MSAVPVWRAADHESVMKTVVLWIGVVAVAAALLIAIDFQSSDADSALYARLSGAIAPTPIARWIAPEWGGAWNLEGPFREHPVGILLLPAAAIRLGIPPEQAAYVVNTVYQVAVILLIPLVVRVVVARHEARALAWVVQLLPIAFVFRIRANQEHPVLMAFVAMLYATERARTQAAWVLLAIAAFCFFLLVKGAFAMFALVAAALWLLLIPTPPGGSDRWAWTGLALTLLVAALLVAGYEAFYVRTTGESFLSFYRARRLGDSMSLTQPGVIRHSLVNVWFYLLRVLWFAAPWSLCVLAVVWTWLRLKTSSATSIRFGDTTARALQWALLVTAVYIIVLSPALVRAERFIFPAYFIIGAAGAVTAMRYFDGFRRFALRSESWFWLAPTVWFVTFLLSLASRIR
jgi:Dolichyl-phosphate-mannose-protein mannosyltransferase